MQLVEQGGKNQTVAAVRSWLAAKQGHGQMIPANSALYYEVDLIDVIPADSATK